MGCDIHFYAEKKNPQTGRWEFLDKIVEEKDGDDTWLSTEESFYTGRNYDLFAILADVRNGRGFAGIKTGEGFNPISAPRGVPDDASDEYKAIASQWDCDGHSHSNHTLRQILDYDWTQSTGLQGWCSFKEWLDWSGYIRNQGLGPRSYCGGVSGGNTAHVSAEQMDAICEQYRKIADKDERETFAQAYSSTYALAVWQEPYYRAAGSFLSETLPLLMKEAGGTAGLDDVRIVFFFDN